MAFLIEGREMPKNCMSCYSNNTHVYIHMLVGCPYIKEAFHNYNLKKERHPDCPLIEVPEPHGRLGDLDEMFDEFVAEGQRSKRYKLGEKWELNGEEIRSVISRLPTVIPANEEG